MHSLHSYFLVGGRPDKPLLFQVHRTRDGQSFSNRRVQAIQSRRVILEVNVSFQVDISVSSSTLEHQKGLPAGVPPPEQCPDLTAQIYGSSSKFLGFDTPGDLRVAKDKLPDPTDSTLSVWFRAQTDPGLGDGDAMHCGAAAYFSDHALLATAWQGHPRPPTHNMSSASLCHSMWFHRRFRADTWLLHRMTSPIASSERGLCFGHIYTQQGELVISTAQEGLMRVGSESEEPTTSINSKM